MIGLDGRLPVVKWGERVYEPDNSIYAAADPIVTPAELIYAVALPIPGHDLSKAEILKAETLKFRTSTVVTVRSLRPTRQYQETKN